MAWAAFRAPCRQLQGAATPARWALGQERQRRRCRHAAGTRRAHGGCGRARRCSSAAMSASPSPRASISPRKPHARDPCHDSDRLLAHHPAPIPVYGVHSLVYLRVRHDCRPVAEHPAVKGNGHARQNTTGCRRRGVPDDAAGRDRAQGGARRFRARTGGPESGSGAHSRTAHSQTRRERSRGRRIPPRSCGPRTGTTSSPPIS